VATFGDLESGVLGAIERSITQSIIEGGAGGGRRPEGASRNLSEPSSSNLGERSHMRVEDGKFPSKGDLVEQHRDGVIRVGYVWYADQLQVLVKWRDGKSSSLRLGRDRFYVRTAAE
jgi:hypothetical protein